MIRVRIMFLFIFFTSHEYLGEAIRTISLVEISTIDRSCPKTFGYLLGSHRGKSLGFSLYTFTLTKLSQESLFSGARLNVGPQG